ncbi:MAG: sodium-translocating pyrophosphatase [Deltaproteobacteria bacterium]|nr:sodium-translocating pyrophosphatase [Deltaproteobacteria bacterium]
MDTKLPSIRGAHGRRTTHPGLQRIFGPITASLIAVAIFLGYAFEAQAGEVNLRIPDLDQLHILGTSARLLLTLGMGVCVLGMLFGLGMYRHVRQLPVHKAMLEISELIYETCKTYLLTQAKFILILETFIGAVVVFYFGYLKGLPIGQVALILLFSLIGIAGSVSVAWFGIRINTFANSRTAFAALRGKPYPCYDIPLKAGMSIGTLLICVELVMMLSIMLFLPSIAGPCFVGFAIGESLGAAALRIAGGIFTKIADIGSDLMKIVLKIKEDDARNPGVIADCTGDNAGDSVGPTADGFETYGVTGVALILFIMAGVPIAVPDPAAAAVVQIQLLTWMFLMRVMMIATSITSYWLNHLLFARRYRDVSHFNFEHPLTMLVWLTSLVSIAATYAASYAIIPEMLGDRTLWWKLATIISCGTLAGAVVPEAVKVFTSTSAGHVREVLMASQKGGASLNILSGLTAGNFSVFWLTTLMVALMGGAYFVSGMNVDLIIAYPAIFSFGLVAFGFLGMGPVTIAVDSYGPVTDNAQSVYELSLIEDVPHPEIRRDFGFEPRFEQAKLALEEADGAGNTFKATAKPVLIGTAVVGATTLIFSIILTLMEHHAPTINGIKDMAAGKTIVLTGLSMLNPMFVVGVMMGGAIIYWFTGATTQAVVTGAYRAVEFIKDNIRLDPGVKRASVDDSKRVVAICTQYAQKGMFNIFLAMFFVTMAFAFFDEFFFIGYLVSIALVGLFQAIFMANAGGAWDNAKKVVETDLKQKGTELHDACVVGDTVGDPFKDTSSVAMNPAIKFTTLFGLLAAELAIEMSHDIRHVLAAVAFGIALVFIWRTFYAMRIGEDVTQDLKAEAAETLPSSSS